MSSRVVVAMSGGVDSSVSAYLLREQGYEVIGLFMRTGVHVSGQEASKAHRKGCCSAIDAADARRVADRLGIPFYALDFEAEFSHIIDYFADEYLAGRTPNPCVVCNNWLKFGKLWSYGKELEADFIATGHYAQVIRGPRGHELHRAADPEKDQSYVLFGLGRTILPRVLFPIGGFRKEQVRALALGAGLSVADKPDSVDICFVPEGDHGAVIRRRRPEAATAGPILDTSGKVLAQHDGIENFTIGQRKGLGFAAGERRYVLQIVTQERAVIVGRRQELDAAGLVAERLNWLIDEAPPEGLRCQVKMRYRHAPASARLGASASGRLRVQFDEPQSAVTPGQAAVFYDGSRVLGGGWIAESIPAVSPQRPAVSTRKWRSGISSQGSGVRNNRPTDR
jgi:tRNA-uridine 2-sulfurtransferase